MSAHAQTPPGPRRAGPPRIGRYRIDRPVGQGGMSQTFRCTLEGMAGFRKVVLVKMLDPSLVHDAAYLEMFLDEARLSARLSHPNIAQVFEVGEEDGVPWLAMEYVAGPNLARISRRMREGGHRHYGHIARLMADVARGLDHAHRLADDHGRPLGIIHRDVSLGNAVVSADGVARLIDFGIAWSRTKSNQTGAGLLKGKLHYMAPEQLEGEVDHRVDIYQAGVCLYWLLVGRPPFHDPDPVSLWRKRLEGRFPTPRSLRPDLPEALEAVVLRALERDPSQRYASAAELADALMDVCRAAGPWRSDARAAAAWIQALFTDDEWEDFRSCDVEFQDTDAALPAPDLGPEVEGFSVEAFEADSADSLLVPLDPVDRLPDDADAPTERLAPVRRPPSPPASAGWNRGVAAVVAVAAAAAAVAAWSALS